MYLPIHFKLLIDQLYIIETMPPLNFLEFRYYYFFIMYKNYDLGKIRIEKTTPVY
jgi:hypothetical protein